MVKVWLQHRYCCVATSPWIARFKSHRTYLGSYGQAQAHGKPSRSIWCHPNEGCTEINLENKIGRHERSFVIQRHLINQKNAKWWIPDVDFSICKSKITLWYALCKAYFEMFSIHKQCDCENWIRLASHFPGQESNYRKRRKDLTLWYSPYFCGYPL